MVPVLEQTTQGADVYTDRPGQLTMTYDGSFIDVRVEHSWPVKTSIWTVGSFMLPEQLEITGAEQEMGDGFVHLRVTAEDIQHDGRSYGRRFRDVALNMEMNDTTFFLLIFDVEPLFSARNSSDQDGHNDEATPPTSLGEDLYLLPLKIDEGLQRSYHPGDGVDIGITIDGNAIQHNSTGFHWTIQYFKDGVLNRLAASCARYYCDESVTMQPSDDPFTLKAKMAIETTNITEGAVLNIATYVTRHSTDTYMGTRGINTLVSLQYCEIVVYLTPDDSSESVPFGSLAFAQQEDKQSRTLEFDGQNTIDCVAIGNPTPHIEFIYRGRPAFGEQSEYMVSKYVDRAELLVGQPNKNLVESGITCRATSAEKVLDLHINLSVHAEVVEELTGIERKSEHELLLTCAARGIPAPNITFYENWMGSDTEVNATATNGVTMTTQKHISDNMVVVEMQVNLEKYKGVDDYWSPRLDSFVCGQLDGWYVFKRFDVSTPSDSTSGSWK